MTGNCSDFWQ